MRKFFIILIFLVSCVSVSYAASEDMSVYVRQDVFDAKMEALFERLHGENVEMKSEIKEEIKTLSGRIDALSGKVDALSGRMDGLSWRMDGIDYKIDVLQTVIYWGLGILSLLVGLFVFAPVIGSFIKNLRQPSLTVEDVKRLIAEAKLTGTPQV